MDTPSNSPPPVPDVGPPDEAGTPEGAGTREQLVAAARQSGASPPVLAALAAIPDDGRHPLLEQLWPARYGTPGDD